MTDPQARIGQLEREVRRWRRVAIVLGSALVVFALLSSWLGVRSHMVAQQAEQAKVEAERHQQEMDRLDNYRIAEVERRRSQLMQKLKKDRVENNGMDDTYLLPIPPRRAK
jgi:hypothetical protein